MRNKSRAFTLIELLVVVLIIGILAAVAMPQYQKAVEKARLTEALVLGKHIRDLEEIYYLANGSYTTSFVELGLDVPAGYTVSGNRLSGKNGKGRFDLEQSRVIYYYWSQSDKPTDLAVFFWFQHSGFVGTQCYPYTNHGTELCKVLKF